MTVDLLRLATLGNAMQNRNNPTCILLLKVARASKATIAVLGSFTEKTFSSSSSLDRQVSPHD
jgi:hypothetical protein